MSIAGLLQGGRVKSRLDADLKDEWKGFALNASRLHPSVGQPGDEEEDEEDEEDEEGEMKISSDKASVGQPRDEEVPQVEPQLGDDGKDAKRVDQKPGIGGATEADHFQGLSKMSNRLVVDPHL